MTITTWTRPAKCKDCKHCKSFYKGKLKRHKCKNKKNTFFDKQIRLNDLVCNNWEM